ncbi:MAG: hypothetical protein WAV25_01625 [Minisyncoccia bacterium]
MPSKGEATTLKAVVQKVVDGKHGCYAVATSSKIEGSITFSLDPDVWQEKAKPQEGYEVVLGDIRKKSAGWRAHSARFLRPEDKVSNSSKKH